MRVIFKLVFSFTNILWRLYHRITTSNWYIKQDHELRLYYLKKYFSELQKVIPNLEAKVVFYDDEHGTDVCVWVPEHIYENKDFKNTAYDFKELLRDKTGRFMYYTKCTLSIEDRVPVLIIKPIN